MAVSEKVSDLNYMSQGCWKSAVKRYHDISATLPKENVELGCLSSSDLVHYHHGIHVDMALGKELRVLYL